MSSSTRFIGLAVFAWAGVRAISLGVVPGTGGLAFDRPAMAALTPASRIPPLEPTQFPAIEPVSPSAAGTPPEAVARPPVVDPAPRMYSGPNSVTLRMPLARQPYGRSALGRFEFRQSSPEQRLAQAERELPRPRRMAFGSAPLTTALPAARPVAVAAPGPVPRGEAIAPALVRQGRRLELSSWALMRGKPGDLLGANSLASSSGTLGGSQAGARISYWITPHLAASLRSSTPLGGARGGEVAAGVRYRPFANLPLSVTAERRQRFGRSGGRNDFALFVEGGLWDRPMPAGFRLDAYAQAGVVGVRSHDLFGDGAFTFTRPLWRRVSGGFGMWGGAQPHLYRLDAGPRLTIAMTRSMRVHLDYRQRLLGTASPSSGPAVTLAGDF